MKARGQEILPRDKEYIRVAARLIAERGYDRTSVRDIADAIGLTSGSMFYHFKSKEKLLEAIIRQGIEDGLQLVREALEPDAPAIVRLHAMIMTHLRIIHGEMKFLHRVWDQEWSRLGPEARATLSPLNQEYRRLWDETLEALQRDGVLNSPAQIARHMLLPSLNWTAVWATPAGDEFERFATEISAVVLNDTPENIEARLQAARAAG
jgi:AcrR family transcriptional regulator